MLIMKGTLTVKTIPGRNGEFNVADLKTEEGFFKVKDAILEELDAGVYTGEFMVSRIFPYSYIHFGRVITDIRVKVEKMALDGQDRAQQTPVVIPEPEPDPIDETPPPPTETPETEAPPPEPQKNNDDETLFGHLYPLETVVKLDSTVDRKIFRQQHSRLKQGLGYEFEIKTQSWCLGTEVDRIQEATGTSRNVARKLLVESVNQ